MVRLYVSKTGVVEVKQIVAAVAQNCISSLCGLHENRKTAAAVVDLDFQSNCKCEPRMVLSSTCELERRSRMVRVYVLKNGAVEVKQFAAAVTQNGISSLCRWPVRMARAWYVCKNPGMAALEKRMRMVCAWHVQRISEKGSV